MLIASRSLIVNVRLIIGTLFTEKKERIIIWENVGRKKINKQMRQRHLLSVDDVSVKLKHLR